MLSYGGAVFVSEFGFGQRASSLMLRKRNKLIVAFAQGVLVAQSATDGGAMIAYRFGRDQKKPVATFRADGSTYTTGNAVITERSGTQGCDLRGDGRQFDVRSMARPTLLLRSRWNALGQPSVVRGDSSHGCPATL